MTVKIYQTKVKRFYWSAAWHSYTAFEFLRLNLLLPTRSPNSKTEELKSPHNLHALECKTVLVRCAIPLNLEIVASIACFSQVVAPFLLFPLLPYSAAFPLLISPCVLRIKEPPDGTCMSVWLAPEVLLKGQL